MRATLNEHRSVHAPFTLPDEQLEFWAGIYRENPAIAARGVSFERFLGAPMYYLLVGPAEALVSVHGAGSPRVGAALMEIARLALEKLERSGAACANGRFVEKLRHHRWPRSRRDFIPGAK